MKLTLFVTCYGLATRDYFQPHSLPVAEIIVDGEKTLYGNPAQTMGAVSGRTAKNWLAPMKSCYWGRLGHHRFTNSNKLALFF